MGLVDLAFGLSSSPCIIAYPWTNASGFGAKYSDPATVMSGGQDGLKFNSKSSEVFASPDSSPKIAAYTWTLGTGFGTKYSDPATLPNTGGQMDIMPDDTAIVITNDTTPFIQAWPWTVGVGWGAKYSNPATLASCDVGYSVIFSPDGKTVALGFQKTAGGAPLFSAWPWTTASGFGAKYTDPAAVAGFHITYGVIFASDNSALLGSDNVGIAAYAFTAGTGFGARYSDLSGASSVARGLAFNSTGTVIFGGMNAGPSLQAWPWTNGVGFGAKYTDPANANVVFGQSVADTSSGGVAIAASNTSPYVFAWPFSGGFGARYSAPGVTPGVSDLGMAFTGNENLPTPGTPAACA